MFHNINVMEDKLNSIDRNYWSIIRKQDKLIICHIIQSPYPKMILSIVIDSDFAAHVFCNDVEIHRIGEYKITNVVTDINIFEILISNLQKIDIEEQQSKRQNDISILKLIMSFLLLLQEESNKYSSAIKFIYEQINLMILNKFNYSTEIIIFSSLLYNCSPTGYRLLRDSKNVILPIYSTIRKLTQSTSMNLVVEQHKNNFFMYIKNKFKLLVQKDITVSLLIDEIHLKPYFDYKGGNVVGLANNINEVATSAFAFMLSCVLSNYKDVIHIMPTKCFKAENLLNIIKRLIIGLEEIGFKVLCAIMDNNAINKKLCLYFVPQQNFQLYIHFQFWSLDLFFSYLIQSIF